MMMTQETRLAVFKRCKWRCKYCGLPLTHEKAIPQIAHKVKNNKYNLKKYGDKIINHPLNLEAVCCLSHNAKYDLGTKQEMINELVNEIILDIQEKNA